MDRSFGHGPGGRAVHPVAESPLFMPLKMVEPSPTTGALTQLVIPPLFHNSLARQAVPSTVGMSSQQDTVACTEDRAPGTLSVEVIQLNVSAAAVVFYCVMFVKADVTC